MAIGILRARLEQLLQGALCCPCHGERLGDVDRYDAAEIRGPYAFRVRAQEHDSGPSAIGAGGNVERFIAECEAYLLEILREAAVAVLREIRPGAQRRFAACRRRRGKHIQEAYFRMSFRIEFA